MAYRDLIDKVRVAYGQDPKILCDKKDVNETFGNDASYLDNEFGITKGNLIRLERLGFAVKAKYAEENKINPSTTGPHHVRWIIFKEVLNG